MGSSKKLLVGIKPGVDADVGKGIEAQREESLTKLNSWMSFVIDVKVRQSTQKECSIYVQIDSMIVLV